MSVELWVTCILALGAIAVATGLAFVRRTRKAEEILHAREGCRLLIASVDVTFRLNMFSFEIALQNSGNTRAYAVDVRGELFYYIAGEQASFVCKLRQSEHLQVAAGMTEIVSTYAVVADGFENPPLGDGQMQQSRLPQLVLHVSHKDVFGKRRILKTTHSLRRSANNLYDCIDDTKEATKPASRCAEGAARRL